MPMTIIIQTQAEIPGLVEKIQALLRQEGVVGEVFCPAAQPVLTFGDLCINGKLWQVTFRGKAIPLTRKEFELLLALASAPDAALTREELFILVWGPESQDTLKVVANTVSNLRKKLAAALPGAAYIQTVPGGYRFRVTT